MNNRIAVGYVFLCLVAVFLVIGEVWAATGIYETAAAPVQLTANAVTYQITITQSAHGTIVPGTTTVDFGATPSFNITPDAGYHIASITANGAAVTVTNPSGQSYQFSAVSANGSLTATFAIDTPPLGLVIAAVIIIVAMIVIWRIPENEYKNTDVLTTDENQEITSLKDTMEKLKNLEAEKKTLLLELEELKRTADAKVAALESEVNALREEVKSQKLSEAG
jgi:hypothetical protein